VFLLPLPPIRPLQHDAGECYELIEDLLDEHGRPVVERGYVTDLASVPRPFRVLLPTSGKITPAAIRHDKRCDDLNEWHRAGRPEHLRPELTSVEADREFLDGLRQLDPDHPLRNLGYWLGVRLGAWASPARRDGAREDAGRVLLAMLLVAPLLVPVAVVNGAALLIDGLANRLACRFTRRALVEVVAIPAPAVPEPVAA
jgi:hypothetical protein